MPAPSRRLIKKYQRLVEVMHNLASVLDLNQLLHNIMDVAVDLAEAEEASILLYDHNTHQLYFESTTNTDKLDVLRSISVPPESIAGWVALNRQPQIVNNVRTDERHFDTPSKKVNFQTASMIAVPLVAKDKLIGVLEVLNKIGPAEFSTDDQEILLALSAQAAIAIENSRLFRQSDLIAEFVHELRTPLASITTASYLLQREQIADEHRFRLASTIYTESQRLTELATIFLDLASLESGRASIRPTSFNLCDLLQECVQVIMIKGQEKNIELIFEPCDQLPPIEADYSKMKQVLLNLLNNAIKYNCQNGKVWLRTSLHGQVVQVAIQDTGVGIPPDQISRLFTKFFRASNVEDQTPGTGLGLSIARRIIEMHGGQIQVESVLNSGTTFTFTIPLKKAE